ncbi:hypothetical protein [Streptomyces phaeochromogenes]|uniref:hypothetical protein n=1 Tax=Streptomyces phaeochromogenes TaxID=1923 RepID=UPI0036924ED6
MVLDILGYNNAVEWRGRRIGVGLRQRMTHALNAAYMSGSTSLEQALPDVYANRQALQQELLSLVDRWARTLRARQGVAVPTSMDGSVGNDGVVALLPLGMGEQVATELVACARESQFDCVAVTAEDCDPTDMELMAQAEVCLAARKLAAVLTEPVAAICHLPCGDCTSLLLCTEGPEGYRRKQIEAVSRCGLG